MADTPNIRFRGFTDDWEQRKLGEILYSLQNNTLSRAELSTEHGIAKNVHYGDILVKFGEVLDVRTEQLPMIINEDVVVKYKASFLQDGDIIVADTAEDETVGKCSEIVGLSGKIVVAGLHTIPYRPRFHFALGYLGYYMNSTAYHHQLLPLMQGIKVTSISKSAMQNTNIAYPKSVDEQAKIGVYFCNLDHLITLHQHKCDETKELKKYMLQKMLPQNGKKIPEIRFAGFTDDWEQHKLKELVDILDGDRGKNYPIETDFSKAGHTLFLNASNVTLNGFSFVDNQYITESKSNSMGNGKLKEDDIIITSRGSLGHVAWFNADIFRKIPNMRINSGMLILRKREMINTSYLYHYMKSDKGQSQISSMSFGSAQPQLTKKGVENLEVIFPESMEEQSQLGDYFTNLDHLITLHQRKCDELKEVKKFMLQNMFPQKG